MYGGNEDGDDNFDASAAPTAERKQPVDKKKFSSRININTTKFPHKLKNAIQSSYDYYKHNEGLRRRINAQQFLVPQYLKGKFTNGVEPRGILLDHDMGTGKTFVFIACIVAVNKPTICVMASALADNFRKNVAQYEKIMKIKISTPIYYVSLDAYNMMEQFGRRLIESGLPSEETIVNRTIIFDEAHEFFSKVTNSNNKNAPKIYSRLMTAVGSTIIFGSGTPISKDPIELVPCFNILHGEAVFPESYKEFYDIFINTEYAGVFENAEKALDPSASDIAKQIHNIMTDTDNQRATIVERHVSLVKNERLLQNRLFGFVSYIPRNLKYFPEKRETRIIKVPMEIEFQFSNYRLARVSEIEEVAKGAKFLKKSVGLSKPSLSGSSTYKQKSRAYCNGVYLDGTDAVTRATKTVIDATRVISKPTSTSTSAATSNKSSDAPKPADVAGGDINYLPALKIISPKADALVKNLELQPGKGIVYSQFKHNGIYIIANKLLEKGWTEVKLSDIAHTISKKQSGGSGKGATNAKANKVKGESSIPDDAPPDASENSPADINFQVRDKDNLEFDVADEAAEEEENADDLFEELRAQVEITAADPNAPPREIEDEGAYEDLPDIVTDPRHQSRSHDEPVGEPAPPTSEQFSKTFIIYDGDVPPNDRKQILAAYNATSNRFGQNVRIILVSSIGTRGINLLCGLHGHYFEPHWYLSTYLQFETRISRFMSHVTMPPEFRYTQLFVYLTTLPDLPDSNWAEPETTDETIYYNSIFKQYIIDLFLNLYKEVSLECGIIDEITERENNINCLQYIPTDIPLYNKNIYQDLSDPPILQEIRGDEQVATKAVVVDSIEYRYTYDNENAKQSLYGVSIYAFNKEVGAYTRLLESDPVFIQVYESLSATHPESAQK